MLFRHCNVCRPEQPSTVPDLGSPPSRSVSATRGSKCFRSAPKPCACAVCACHFSESTPCLFRLFFWLWAHSPSLSASRHLAFLAISFARSLFPRRLWLAFPRSGRWRTARWTHARWPFICFHSFHSPPLQSFIRMSLTPALRRGCASYMLPPLCHSLRPGNDEQGIIHLPHSRLPERRSRSRATGSSRGEGIAGSSSAIPRSLCAGCRPRCLRRRPSFLSPLEAFLPPFRCARAQLHPVLGAPFLLDFVFSLSVIVHPVARIAPSVILTSSSSSRKVKVPRRGRARRRAPTVDAD
ncbi:hypothetical protein C8R44DRAFT_785702 [Mycena epipterygia]|nr:hypothetical protein C8R44DRAFT_785702 [Mycena epipterygia]